MIDLGALASLREHDHGLAAYRRRCACWAVLPLAELVTEGKGSLRVPTRVRCKAKRPHWGRMLRFDG